MAKGKATGKGKHWKSSEVNLMLDLVEDVLPRGQNDWESVAHEFNIRVKCLSGTHEERDETAIRSKFKTLRNCKKPTGDPTCPPEVRRAKSIQRDIEREISVAEEDDGMDSDSEATRHEPCSESEEDTQLDGPIIGTELDTELNSQVDDPMSQSLPTSRSILASVSSTSSYSSLSRHAAKKTSSTPASAYKTTTRTGYTEAELVQMGKRSLGTILSESVKKRRNLDAVIEDTKSKSSSFSEGLLSMMAFQQEQRRAEMEERREREERQQLRLERLEEERRVREQKRDELMMIFFSQFIPKKD